MMNKVLKLPSILLAIVFLNGCTTNKIDITSFINENPKPFVNLRDEKVNNKVAVMDIENRDGKRVYILDEKSWNNLVSNLDAMNYYLKVQKAQLEWWDSYFKFLQKEVDKVNQE